MQAYLMCELTLLRKQSDLVIKYEVVKFLISYHFATWYFGDVIMWCQNAMCDIKIWSAIGYRYGGM